jgi:Holliday junction resolvasome RuvABC DNA-binding subunit
VPKAASHGKDIAVDAESALINLGYSRDVARKSVAVALERRPREGTTLEVVLREALGGLNR